MRLAVVASRVSPMGGMERAAWELLGRLAESETCDITVLTEAYERMPPGVRWVPLQRRPAPALFQGWLFDRAVGRGQSSVPGALFNSVGVTTAPVHVITAHFCQRGFVEQCGALRGGGRALRRGYQAAVGRWENARERRAYAGRQLRAVIAVSQGIRRELIEYYHLPEERVVVIPNGVDHSTFHPLDDPEEKARLRRELRLPESSLLALFVGGDWDRKGLNDAILAVATLPDVALVVVGRGDVARFRATAQRSGADGRVIFAGLTPTPEKYLAAGDVYVFPSRYEAFPLSPLEAAASGLPVLAPRINGIEEWLEDGVNGLFIEHDPESIRAGLCRLRDDAAARYRLGQAASRTASRYTWEGVAREQLRLFESLSRLPS